MIRTFADCPDYVPVDEDIGGLCVSLDNDFTMCKYGCDNGLCPRGFQR